MYSLVFYVPETHLESVKQALFLAGAGLIGDYSLCCWQIKGQGQFCPNNQATPYIGERGIVEKVDEYRVEMILKDELKEGVTSALLAAHPYEEAAYYFIPVQS